MTKLLLLVLLTMTSLLLSSIIPSNCQSNLSNKLVSVDFNQMVNAAMKQVASSQSFTSYIASHVSFNVPTCSSKAEWPNQLPIPSKIQELKLCYDQFTYDTVWVDIYRKVGLELVRVINEKYGSQLKDRFVLVNTTSGYFQSMKSAVESEECDISVADSTYTDERMAQVQFSDCGYGSTSNGFIRSLLDSDYNSTFSQLKDIEFPKFYSCSLYWNLLRNCNQSILAFGQEG